MAEIQSQGYDNSISVREDDHLNRWPFAREVFNLADTTPPQWSARIGIYGVWGTGKTSVMKFIARMAEEKSHVVVPFNPSPYRTTSEMWEAFIPIVYQALKNAGLQLEDYQATMAKSIGKKVANRIENADKLVENLAGLFGLGLAAKITQAGLSTLTGFLQANSQQLQQISEILKDRRVIVLIDDLDRTELHLLPEVLYALREVLDLPGFIFILAFDPAVVGEALKEHHPGWGNGTRFLEKIIDFPRPLPPPTKKQLLKLAKSDITRHSNFIDLDALEDVFEFLPENPRQLRSFIRSLWGIKSQVMRHDSTELRWLTLLLVHLLKFKQPDFAHALFQNEQMLQDWALSKVMPDKMEGAKQKFEALCNDAGLDDKQEKQECISIIDAIASKNLLGWNATTFSEMARLTEEPPLLTGKELEAALTVWVDTQNPDSIREWIVQHTDKIESTYDLVFISLFEKLVVYWDNQLQQAADALTDENCSRYIKKAGNTINLLTALGLTLDGFVGDNPLLSIEHFLHILTISDRWLHFDSTPDYQTQRNLERDLLERIARETTLDPVLLLEALQPWNAYYRGSTFHRGRSRNLYHALDIIVEPKAAERVPNYLKTKDISTKQDVLRYLILRQKNTLWESSNLRQDVLQMAATADTSPIVQQNLLKLFDLFAEELERECSQVIVTSEYIHVPVCPEFLHDLYIIEELWKGALATALNPRMISIYAEFRRTIQKYIDVQLTIPDSWSQWLSRIENRAL